VSKGARAKGNDVTIVATAGLPNPRIIAASTSAGDSVAKIAA